ncbi:MAG: cytidine deaminase [Clostridiales bacterium]|jgi:cytidine deaminase|nr:cytidine deaminase [Clostridiales bacterium]
MDDKALFLKAQSVLDNAYAPYSNFKVGAAVLTKSGKVYTGVNVENSSYGATICAERSAILSAVSDGEKDFAAIAIASSSGEAYPCGICRQFMYEFGDDIRIITGEDSDNLNVHTIEELLPKGFRLK